MINMIQRVFWAQFPAWARPKNAVFRYVRQQQNVNRGALWRWLRRVSSLAILAGLVTLSYAAAQNNTPILMESPTNYLVFDVLYFPLVVIQGSLLLFVALFSVGGAISADQQRGTWDTFKVTSHGAELMVRARWAALFFQTRWILALLIGARLLFIGLMLVDLTKNEGDYLELYTFGITPDISLEAAVLLLAAFMAAVLLQIAVVMGLNAALGLLIAVVVHSRNMRALTYGVVVVVEWSVWGWALRAGKRLLDGDPAALVAHNIPAAERWIRLFGMGVVGDQGLRLMDLETYLQAWADVPYGVMIGLALLAAVLVQVMITNGLLILAGRWAARPGRE
jgi:hypothetical protein